MSPADRSSDFGSKLRAARERKGVSLRQIADQTKISLSALEALERNDISRLPGGIFSRSFVRSYALEVGLDPDATIQDFSAQFPQDAIQPLPETTDTPDRDIINDSGPRASASIAWILAISLPIAGIAWYFSGSTRRAVKVDAPAAAASTPRDATPGPPPTPRPTEPAVAQSMATASGEPPAGAAAVPALAAPAASTPAPPAAAAAASPTAAAPAAAAEDNADRLTVKLTARRPVWVSATVDGQKAIERLLQTGDQQTVEIKREMVLTAGDAAALSLTLNGADARPLGKSGDVVTTRLNLTNYKDYLQTR